MSTDTRSSAPTLTDRIGHAVGDGRDTVVLAGHFAIFTAGGKATDFLDEDPTRMSKHTDMVHFARATWLAGCDAVALTQAKLLVLVDDLQFVRPALPDRGARERLGAALSADYLRRTPTLPGFHARVLDERELALDLLRARHATRRGRSHSREGGLRWARPLALESRRIAHHRTRPDRRDCGTHDRPLGTHLVRRWLPRAGAATPRTRCAATRGDGSVALPRTGHARRGAGAVGVWRGDRGGEPDRGLRGRRKFYGVSTDRS
jgi:hypothetical protein